MDQTDKKKRLSDLKKEGKALLESLRSINPKDSTDQKRVMQVTNKLNLIQEEVETLSKQIEDEETRH